MAFALRSIDRDTYNKLLSNECSPFEAAASFREKFNFNNVDHLNRGSFLTALVLSLDFRKYLNLSEETFIEQFVGAGVGDQNLGAAMHPQGA